MSQKQNKPIEESSWTKFIKYINTHVVSWVIFRRDLIKYLYDEHGLKGKISEQTMDVYRSKLTSLGYLEEIVDSYGITMRGKYRLVKHIPEDLPSSTTIPKNPNNQSAN